MQAGLLSSELCCANFKIQIRNKKRLSEAEERGKTCKGCNYGMAEDCVKLVLLSISSPF